MNNQIMGERDNLGRYIKGHKVSEESIRKTKIANTGRHLSLEARKNISQKLKGKKKPPFTKEHRENIRKANLGRKWSKETRDKMFHKGMFGKHPTQETKDKIGKANFKTGKTKHDVGYILVRRKSHPYCDHRGYIYEHRFIMEQHLNRYLTPQEVVHHINKINDDNRVENLMLFKDNAEHIKYHKKLRC